MNRLLDEITRTAEPRVLLKTGATSFPDAKPLCVRWTIGDVSDAGFEALHLSIHGARRLFGPDAIYVVCVNTVSVEEARCRAGPLPDDIEWRSIERTVPQYLRAFLTDDMSEGTGWKLVPPRLHPGAYELALDNDVILWALPQAIRRWLPHGGGQAPVIAADVVAGHGRFAALCGPEPRNSGIRGIPDQFDFEGAIASVLEDHPAELVSELDEQGLQVAAVCRAGDSLVVTTNEVSICSPFPPHQSGLGSCGAHFVGLNARHIPWRYYDRPATEVRLEHWRQHRPELYARVGLPMPQTEPIGFEAV